MVNSCADNVDENRWQKLDVRATDIVSHYHVSKVTLVVVKKQSFHHSGLCLCLLYRYAISDRVAMAPGGAHVASGVMGAGKKNAETC